MSYNLISLRGITTYGSGLFPVGVVTMVFWQMLLWNYFAITRTI